MSNIIRRCALVLIAITCVGFAVGVACGRTSNTAPMQSAPPEGWNGLATHGSTYCNVDAAIVTFWNAYSAWYRLEEGAGKSLTLDDQRDFLGKIGKLPQTRPCVACFSADVAVRRFAPLALAAGGRPDLARWLRQLKPIRDPADARVAADKVADVLTPLLQRASDETEIVTDSFAAARSAFNAAYESVQRAAIDDEVRKDEFLSDGDWCIAFEGLSQHDDKTMETLMFAVGAGVPKERAIQEAELLLTRFVRLAKGHDAG